MGDLVPDKAVEGNGYSVDVEAGGLVPTKVTLDKGGGTFFWHISLNFCSMSELNVGVGCRIVRTLYLIKTVS